MKKATLTAGIALAMGITGSAQAAFTALVDGNYTMTLDSGCFEFGGCTIGGAGNISDSVTGTGATPFVATVTLTAAVGLTPAGTYGSGIVGDGVVGVINFDLSGGVITSVNSFNQDTYVSQAGGNFWVDDDGDPSSMGGTIDGSGTLIFDTTGRIGLSQNQIYGFGYLPWNTDDATHTLGTGTGLYTPWTTGQSTSYGLSPFGSPTTITGTALQDSGAGMWTGALVSRGNIGTPWGSFEGTEYEERFNITIVQNSIVEPPEPIPVPAAVWLFGSGLIGLVGVARRKKS